MISGDVHRGWVWDLRWGVGLLTKENPVDFFDLLAEDAMSCFFE
jgi:hypothetical protein